MYLSKVLEEAQKKKEWCLESGIGKGWKTSLQDNAKETSLILIRWVKTNFKEKVTWKHIMILENLHVKEQEQRTGSMKI